MWKKPTRLRLLIIVFVVVLYVAVLLRATTESTRRSLQLRDETSAQDRIVVSVLVTNVNPVTQELTAQLGFRLAGDIALDEVTPAADLELLVNNVGGQQAYDFPKGKRMNRIEVVFPLNGELNRYPFDRYETTMWLLMTLRQQVIRRSFRRRLGLNRKMLSMPKSWRSAPSPCNETRPWLCLWPSRHRFRVSSSGAVSRATRPRKSQGLV
jgi:hypothetical protein